MLSKRIALPLAVAVVIVAVAVVGFTLLRASDDAGADVPADVQAPTPQPSADADSDTDEDSPAVGGQLGADPNLLLSPAEAFVGLTREEAASIAEAEGRRWRVGREDGVSLPATEDFVVGRVTFDLESDRVTAASIEQPFDDAAEPSTPLDVEDEA